MQFFSLDGTKTVSTAAPFDFDTNQGYLGLLYITVYDSEGEYEEFIIILLISEGSMGLPMIWIIIFAVIAIISSIGVSIFLFLRRRKRRVSQFQPTFPQYYRKDSIYDQIEPRKITEPVPRPEFLFYCPFCGETIRTPKRFCPHCGESLQFEQ